MNNTELLTAISNIMDQKLEEKVVPQIKNLEKRFDGLEERFDGLEEQFVSLDNRVKNIELTLENNVVPRLSHIEQCYIDTFERYQKGIDRLDDMQRDIDVIKITVTGHSDELNKITGPYLVK